MLSRSRDQQRVMSKAARATKSDIQRVLQAMTAAGIPVGGVRLDPDGTIHAFVSNEENGLRETGWEDLD